MAELRSVDPRTLTLNPNNPRTSAVPKEMDQQLVASIMAIGLLQPPAVREIDGALVVRAGDRRTRPPSQPARTSSTSTCSTATRTSTPWPR